MHGHFELQAAVVRSDDLVAETGGNHQVGSGQLVLQQPGRAHFAAKFLVIGEQQLNAALGRLAHRFERAHGKGEGGKVALAHRTGTAVQFAILNLAAIRVMGPALARGHHVAMGVERNGFAARPVAVAHDQVGDALQAGGVYLGGRYRVLFGLDAHGLQQFGRALGVRRVVARRRVGGHANEFLQKAHLFVKVGVDPGVKLGVSCHGRWLLKSGRDCRAMLAMTGQAVIATSASDAAIHRACHWLIASASA